MVVDLVGDYVKRTHLNFKLAKGYQGFISGLEFYKLAKQNMQLPDETTEIAIRIAVNEIATTTIKTATPIGSLNFLKEYKLVTAAY